MSLSTFMGVAAQVTPWLARLLLSGIPVTIAALALGRLFERHSGSTRTWIWRAGVLAMLAVPVASIVPWRWVVPDNAVTRPIAYQVQVVSGSVESETSAAASPAAPAGAASAQTSAASSAVAPLTAEPAANAPAWIGSGGIVTPAQASSWWRRVFTTIPPGSAFAILWASVAVGLMLYLALGLVALRLYARRATDVSTDVLRVLTRSGEDPKRKVRVLRGGRLQLPVCWGVMRPTVLLPDGYEQWGAGRLRMVLLHETAHVDRLDTVFLMLAWIACALNWLNPFAWVLHRKMCVDAEVACDETVVRRGVAPREYAALLVELAAEARQGPRASLAPAFTAEGSLTLRVTRLLQPRPRRPLPREQVLTASVAMPLLALMGATATMQTQPIVRDAIEAVVREAGEVTDGAMLWLDMMTLPAAPIDATLDATQLQPADVAPIALGAPQDVEVLGAVDAPQLVSPAAAPSSAQRAASEVLGKLPTMGATPQTRIAIGDVAPSRKPTSEQEEDPMPVDGLTVDVSATNLAATGFYDRAKMSFGRFLTPETLAQWHVVAVTELLSTAGRVQIGRDAENLGRVTMRVGAGTCSPAVWVDGTLRIDGQNLDDVVPRNSLAAIEVYESSLQVPVQWAGGKPGCGAILLWTKR
jgi:beta-lactamase regulating signal transducer with metallopeptidase domain